jgi:hypothetical protein
VKILPGDNEYILWISIDKHLFNISENAVLGFIYFSPENSRFLNESEINSFENEIISRCSFKKYVFLVGDVNARVAELADYLPSDPFLNELFEIDESSISHLDSYVILEKLSINLDRKSKDKRCNSHGLMLIDLCRNNNLFIVNGRYGNDLTGNFTFREKSVIDYLIVTANCFSLFEKFEILETDSLFSDGHNALYWSINLKQNSTTQTQNNVKNSYIKTTMAK